MAEKLPRLPNLILAFSGLPIVKEALEEA